PSERGDGAIVRSLDEVIAVSKNKYGVEGPAYPPGVADDGVEYRLNVGQRLADHAKNLAGRRLPLQSVGLSLYTFGFPLQRLGQALLEIAAPRIFVLGRLAAYREWRFGPSCLALCTRRQSRPAFQAELRLGRVLLLASGTFHAHSPRTGHGSGL